MVEHSEEENQLGEIRTDDGVVDDTKVTVYKKTDCNSKFHLDSDM